MFQGDFFFFLILIWWLQSVNSTTVILGSCSVDLYDISFPPATLLKVI